jgi:hypothetical protein
MNKFNRISAAVLAGMALYGASGASHGLGFGRPTSRAILGETLSVTVPINVDTANDIANECVAADVYFGDDKLAGDDVTTVLLPGAGSARVIKVTTRKFVDEPVITLYVIAGCQAKVSRKFVAFADPPSATAPSQSMSPADSPAVAYSPKAGTVKVGGMTVEAGGSTIAAAPADEAVTSTSRHRPKRTASAASKSTAGSGSDVLQGAPSMALSPRAQAQSARVSDEATLAKRQGAASAKAQSAEPRRPSGERLMLDPVDADALIQPNLSMTAALQGKFEGDDPSPEVRERRAAAAAMWLAMNASPEQLMRDQQRMQELEKRLADLKQASAQSQQQIAQLQSKVREAESVQSNPTLVYALGGLAALLAAAVAVLFLKDRRKGGRPIGGRPMQPWSPRSPSKVMRRQRHRSWNARCRPSSRARVSTMAAGTPRLPQRRPRSQRQPLRSDRPRASLRRLSTSPPSPARLCQWHLRPPQPPRVQPGPCPRSLRARFLSKN